MVILYPFPLSLTYISHKVYTLKVLGLWNFVKHEENCSVIYVVKIGTDWPILIYLMHDKVLLHREEGIVPMKYSFERICIFKDFR